MKTILAFAVMAAMAAVAQTSSGPTVQAGEAGVGPLMRPGGPDAAARAKLRAGMYARMGGPVMRPNLGPGICFVNAQSAVPAAAFEPQLMNIRNEFRISCYLRSWGEVAEGEAPAGLAELLAEVSALAAKTNHACVVCIVDRPDLPQVLSAADSGWSVVNVAPLKADGPDAAKLAVRAGKVAWRGFGLSMGAGFSAQAGGLLQPATTLAELDAIYGTAVPPDCHFPILNYCELRKVARGGTAPYRIACKEGWAPPPKDDVQRKIWEEFHK